MALKKIQIGKVLLDEKLITQEQLDNAISKQHVTGNKLGQVLIDLGYIDEEVLLKFLSEQLQINYINLKNYQLNPEVVHLLPEFDARRFRAIVLKKEEHGLQIAMADPQDILAFDELNRILQQPLEISLVREVDLLKAIDMTYRHTSEITTLAGELSQEIGKNDYDIAKLSAGLSSEDTPVVKLLQTLFEDAAQVNASDVHIEPDEHVLRIRQRIDGVLHEQVLRESYVAQALTLRLKLMAGLNIAEKRLPQDGRFSIKLKNKNFDVRLSTLPVSFGESVVMRLLNQSADISNLDRIGMPSSILTRVRKIVTLPHGLFLITGPTGSGKTTSLYAILSELNVVGKKIITVEDPVEYRISRINQVQVQPKINFMFANALRAILRQDPDIIMIGELRDQETASIALRAAMTGHFVLSTLHTNDAASSAIRLIDMGTEGYLVATVLRAILAQRLIRKICLDCSVPYEPTSQEKIWLSEVKGFSSDGVEFKHGKGCSYCHQTGYKGQTGVYELLEMNMDLENALRNNDTELFMQLTRDSANFRPMVLNGLEFVGSGLTTISEIMRIVGENFLNK